jgi:hypothetical protein
MYPELHDQLREASSALGLDSTKLGFHRAASIVLDDASLRVFAGITQPELIFTMPAGATVGMRIARAPQGKWVLPSLELDLSQDGQQLVVDFCLMNSNFGFPHAIGLAELERQFVNARAARNGSGRAPRLQ